MKKKNWIFILLGVLLLAALVEVIILLSVLRDDEIPAAPQAYATLSPTATAVPTPAATPVPTPTAAPTLTATPLPTETPSPTPEPTATPTPSPSPTAYVATPRPEDSLIASGRFQSDTGTALNLLVDWGAYDDGSGNAVIYLTGKLASYSLEVSERYAGVTIAFAGQSWSYKTEAIRVADGVYTESLLFSDVLTVPLGSGSTMTVTYDYKGSYSGQTLEAIVAEGSVTTN